MSTAIASHACSTLLFNPVCQQHSSFTTTKIYRSSAGYHPRKAIPKTAVNRPIIEFGGMEGFFNWRPFYYSLSRNRSAGAVVIIAGMQYDLP